MLVININSAADFRGACSSSCYCCCSGESVDDARRLLTQQWLMHSNSVSRGFELDHPGGFASSPWAAAMLGHHHSAAAAAAAAAGGMMQPADHHGYPHPHPGAGHGHPGAAAAAAAAAAATAVPMDLHMPQGFPYYR